jgi:hypothetical protein
MFVNKANPSCPTTYVTIVWSNCCNLEQVFLQLGYKRVMEISNPVWTQLTNNERILLFPQLKALPFFSWIDAP